MKALFGAAVFGLVAVPPISAGGALAGSTKDRRLTTDVTDNFEELPLASHADGKSDDLPKAEPAADVRHDIDAELTPEPQRG
jgi:hypothetical protein